MRSPDSPIPDDTRRKLDAGLKLAKKVDDAVTAAVPEIVDLQVAAAAGGIVVISGIVPSPDAQRWAEEAARSVEGVTRFINSLTVHQGPA